MFDPRSPLRTLWASKGAISSGNWKFGYCWPCAHRTIFIEEAEWLRDHYRCLRCGSIPRWRVLLLILEEQFPDWRFRRIHEFTPGGAASGRLAAECPNTYSFYGVPQEPHEELEWLSFSDSSIDIVVTQDVMEYVVDTSKSFSEIARVLPPGGAHLFTVPIFDRADTTVRAIRAADGELHQLDAPDFHQSPEGPFLVIRERGTTSVIIDACGPTRTFRHHRVHRALELDGKFLDVCMSVRNTVPGRDVNRGRADGSG